MYVYYKCVQSYFPLFIIYIFDLIFMSIQVDLPKKHGRGGQSALRFARLRIEKRHNYVRRVAELSTQLFITNDRVNMEGGVVL